MIILGRIEILAGFDLGDDRRIEYVGLVELMDIGIGDARLLRTPQKQPSARIATSDVA